MMKVTGGPKQKRKKKKRLVPVLMLKKKKKIHRMDSLCVIVSKQHDKRLQKAIIFTRNI